MQTALCSCVLTHASATTVLRNTPICGTSISTVSPGFSQTAGSAALELHRRAGGDDIAGLERHEGADIGDQFGKRLDHAGGGVVLRHFAVDLNSDVQRLGEIDLVGGHDPRADAAAGVPVLALRHVEFAVPHPVADGAFVAQRHAGHMIERRALARCADRRGRSPARSRLHSRVARIRAAARSAVDAPPASRARDRTCWDIAARPDRHSRHCGWHS